MSWTRRMTRAGQVTGGSGGFGGARRVWGDPPTHICAPPGAHEEVDYSEKLKFSDEEDGRDEDEDDEG